MTGHITFLLNGEVQRLSGVTPATTLYQLLRSRGLTGTKEGCAEGDCGACTVAVTRIEDGEPRVRAVNSCIMLAGQLEGTSITTVEHLKGPDGMLHPCQRAMADAHASQCGFCTPGFVMSLYAAYATNAPTEQLQDVNDLLAGNLCRCTGYGPIIEAARRMKAVAEPAWAAERRAAEATALTNFPRDKNVEFTHDGQRLFSPTTADELARILILHPEATIVAGATDVGLWITKQFREVPILVSIARIAELTRLARSGDKLWIGAGVTYSEAHAMLGKLYPDLGELIRRLGSQLIRNSGTICGNIANGSPIGDMPPALIALGSTLVLRCGDTQRRMPLEDYFLAYGRQDRRPGEFVEAVEVQLSAKPSELKCYKISKRFDQDISAVCGCFNIGVDGGVVRTARICFGGMAGTPKRPAEVEIALVGKPWTLATVEAALPAFEVDYTPLTDLRASAGYRMMTAKNLLRRYFIETQVPCAQTRLAGVTAAFG